MKNILLATIALTLALVYPTKAIVGLGFHYNTALGSKLDGSTDEKAMGLLTSKVTQGEATGLQGFGLKLWLDFIPVVDIEVATNLQVVEYDLEVHLMDDGTIPLDTMINMEIETGLPLKDKAKPVWGKITSDLSIKYPFFKFPPAVNIVKFYVGGGVSHTASILVLDADNTIETIENANPTIDANTTEETLVEEVTAAVSDKVIDDGYSMGFGGHALVGVKVKPPVIPIAIYTDGKYHFGGNLPDAVSTGFTLEIGAALAF